MVKKVKVTLTRSVIGEPPKVHRIVQALGLGKVGSSALQWDNPAIGGMLQRIRHLVKVEEI